VCGERQGPQRPSRAVRPPGHHAAPWGVDRRLLPDQQRLAVGGPHPPRRKYGGWEGGGSRSSISTSTTARGPQPRRRARSPPCFYASTASISDSIPATRAPARNRPRTKQTVVKRARSAAGSGQSRVPRRLGKRGIGRIAQGSTISQPSSVIVSGRASMRHRAGPAGASLESRGPRISSADEELLGDRGPFMPGGAGAGLRARRRLILRTSTALRRKSVATQRQKPHAGRRPRLESGPSHASGTIGSIDLQGVAGRHVGARGFEADRTICSRPRFCRCAGGDRPCAQSPVTLGHPLCSGECPRLFRGGAGAEGQPGRGGSAPTTKRAHVVASFGGPCKGDPQRCVV